MNKRHLFWIIPLIFIIGGIIGFKLAWYMNDNLSEMINTFDECSAETLKYVAEKNDDCQILMSGYISKCISDLEKKK